MQPANVRFLLQEQSNHSKSKRLWGMLIQYAIDLGWRDTDHTVDVRRVKVRSVGIHSWTDAKIAQYEAHWPPGSKPRLALAILLYTGQRRSDAVRMGPADTIEGTIRVRQVKTGAGLLIPVHPALEIELSAWTDCGAGTFLATERGRPFSVNGFYNNFVSWCADAGLPKGCSPHGLRKAAARR
ncbi:tyrosine-type recombinase/integrase [Novacetimonas hansenii]|uniref:tyrosine-type recombinase/integrase n=1 Tax=Novacetimonas hansenii TaxID=436 RepID=UPI0009C0CC91|nr:tyrosine-type recombinase/integrase [Novacetimonas hansenii]WEQ58379.1 tyrosine-type recombinase/integrase [Novacetimonas hansenii]